MKGVRGLLVALAGALALPAAAHAAGPVGTLTQFAGAAGCVDTAAAESCADGRAMSGIGDIALVPNGLLAPSSPTSEIAVLRIDPATGTLSQPATQAGCVAADPGGDGSCRLAFNMQGVRDIATVSLGGKTYAYAAGDSGLASFQYLDEPPTGGLFQRGGQGGCLSPDDKSNPGNVDNKCANARAIGGAKGIAASPDGANLYVAQGAGDEAGLAILKVDPATGVASQPPATAAGCITRNSKATGDADDDPPTNTIRGCAGPGWALPPTSWYPQTAPASTSRARSGWPF